MKLFISYFYKIRFFKRDMIPLSTAVYNPKWYSNNGTTYYDSNGVLCGTRMPVFVPGSKCSNLCHGAQNCTMTPDKCDFLKKYREQLDAIDYSKLKDSFEQMATSYQEVLGLDYEPTFVLIVYETPTNPCSERWPLIAWFKDHGYELKEFT